MTPSGDRFYSSRTSRTRSSWRDELSVPRRQRPLPARAPGGRGRRAGEHGHQQKSRAPLRQRPRSAPRRAEMFFGPHQGGIATAQQTTAIRRLRPLAKTRDEMTPMLRLWTGAAARMTSGNSSPFGEDLLLKGRMRVCARSPAVTADHHLRLRPRAVHEGRRRPLRPCRQTAGGAGGSTKFNGDQLQPRAPATTFRSRLRRRIRWSRPTRCASWIVSPTARPRSAGRDGLPASLGSRRNAARLDGLEDGTNLRSLGGARTSADVPRGFDDVVWVGEEGPDWMEAAAISLRAESGFRSSIGIEPRSTFRSR